MIYSPENLWKEREQSKQSKASSLIYLLKFLDNIRLESKMEFYKYRNSPVSAVPGLVRFTNSTKCEHSQI